MPISKAVSSDLASSYQRHCQPLGTYIAKEYLPSGHSAITDVILALYPIHLIWGVQMSKRLKIGLCCLMGFGLLAAVTSTIKTIELRNLTQTQDNTYYISRLAFATMIEAWIVLIVGCVPSLRPLMKTVVKRLWGTPSTIPTKQSFPIYTDQHDKYGKYSNQAKSNDTRLDGAGHNLRGDESLAYFRPKTDIIELLETHNLSSPRSFDNENSSNGSGTIVKTTDISVRFDPKAADRV